MSRLQQRLAKLEASVQRSRKQDIKLTEAEWQAARALYAQWQVEHPLLDDPDQPDYILV